MIPLYDDHFYIERACEHFRGAPGDRFAINGLSCLLGESVDAVRTVSFLAVAASVVLLVIILNRIFSRVDSQLLMRERSFQWSVGFAMLLHPMVLFPVFYAVQVSTALSVLWALLVAFGLDLSLSGILRRDLWTVLFIAISGALAFFGSVFRHESNFIFLLIIGALTFLEWILDPVFGPRRLFRVGLGAGVMSLLFYSGMSLLRRELPGVPSQIDFFAAAVVQTADYPVLPYYGSQSLAIFQYLFNWFFPALHSFTGSWADWFFFARSPVWSLGGLCLLGLFSVLVALICRDARVRGRRVQALLWASIGIFLVCVMAQSSLVRTDWYYPSRQYLGSLLGLAFVYSGWVVFTREHPDGPGSKRIAIASMIYLALSALYSVFFHYQSYEDFYRHEERFTRVAAPVMLFSRASQSLLREDWFAAERDYDRIIEQMPYPEWTRSLRAENHRMLALYYKFYTVEKQGRRDEVRPILNQMYPFEHYLTTMVCLQLPEMSAQDCLRDDRVVRNFCRAMRSAPVVKPLLIRPLRKSVSEICGT